MNEARCGVGNGDVNKAELVRTRSMKKRRKEVGLRYYGLKIYKMRSECSLAEKTRRKNAEII